MWSVIWRGLNTQANLLTISTSTLTWMGAARRPRLTRWPGATLHVKPHRSSSLEDSMRRSRMTVSILSFVKFTLTVSSFLGDSSGAVGLAGSGWNKPGVTYNAIYTERVDNCLKVRLLAKHKQAFCDSPRHKRKSASHVCQPVCRDTKPCYAKGLHVPWMGTKRLMLPWDKRLKIWPNALNSL